MVSQVQRGTELSTRIFVPRKFRVQERYFGGSLRRGCGQVQTQTPLITRNSANNYYLLISMLGTLLSTIYAGTHLIFATHLQLGSIILINTERNWGWGKLGHLPNILKPLSSGGKLQTWTVWSLSQCLNNYTVLNLRLLGSHLGKLWRVSHSLHCCVNYPKSILFVNPGQSTGCLDGYIKF